MKKSQKIKSKELMMSIEKESMKNPKKDKEDSDEDKDKLPNEIQKIVNVIHQQELRSEVILQLVGRNNARVNISKEYTYATFRPHESPTFVVVNMFFRDMNNPLMRIEQQATVAHLNQHIDPPVHNGTRIYILVPLHLQNRELADYSIQYQVREVIY